MTLFTLIHPETKQQAIVRAAHACTARQQIADHTHDPVWHTADAQVIRESGVPEIVILGPTPKVRKRIKDATI